MFSKVGTMELLVILVIALFIIGPEKLPDVAKSVGRLLGTARHYLKDVMEDVGTEVKAIEADFKGVETSLKETQDILKQPFTGKRKEESAEAPDALPEGTPPEPEFPVSAEESFADEDGEEEEKIS